MTVATFIAYPDQRYYIEVTQHDDGSFSAQPKPLDDTTQDMMDHSTGTLKATIVPGLRSLVRDTMINPTTQNRIYSYAPPYAQANANNIIANPTAYTTQEVTDAKAMWTWINASIAYSNTLQADVETMTFEQIIVYVVPIHGWPDPPASLVPPLPPSLV